MHNLFLKLIKEHFGGILGLELAWEMEETALNITFSNPPRDFNLQGRKSVGKLKRWLEALAAKVFPMDQKQAVKELQSLHLHALQFACDQLYCTLPPSLSTNAVYPKSITAAVILDWVKLSFDFIGSP